MKTFLRMIVFVVIGYLVSFVLIGVVMVAVIPLSSTHVSEDTDQGGQISILQMAIDGEKFSSIINLALWPVILGTAYGLERGWRFWRHQPVKKAPGWLRWLGAAVTGLIAAIMVDSAYKLWLIFSLPTEYLVQPSTYGRELAEFGQRFEASGTITILVWIGATILLGWLSGQSPQTQPDSPSTFRVSAQQSRSDDSTSVVRSSMK
ncbi:MAG: hypothetical protein JW953_11215 [Anaerolineae bacterium]|nr:hypothetical protein [Anaerolineae bacterium]